MGQVGAASLLGAPSLNVVFPCVHLLFRAVSLSHKKNACELKELQYR